eukprot:Skav202245  [mRNA]  locus=scaffold1417:155398:166678:+ [translate_table: standard]
MAFLSPDFTAVGTRLDLVVTMVCGDVTEMSHLVACMATHKMLRVRGAIPLDCMSVTLLQARVIEGGRLPMVEFDINSRVLSHPPCVWDDLRKVFSVCCGMGGLDHGVKAAGFEVVAAVDHNAKMISMHRACHSVPTICGAIGDVETLTQMWTIHARPAAIVAGIACQPYSVLGDRLQGDDVRAQSLPDTLKAAYALRCPLVILECVEPAMTSDFVQQNIQEFCACTGFKLQQTVLHLQDLFPCRRSRWWAILSSPAIGQISIPQMLSLYAIKKVASVIPRTIKWDAEEELQLKLNQVERDAFGADDDACPHALNHLSVLPCPLHAWGSQLGPCPCGCRPTALSPERLAAKGLFGVLIRTVDDLDFRHIHPAEVSACVGLDPYLHHDDDLKLVLSGLGQIASPVQSVWIFAAIASKLEVLRSDTNTTDPMRELLAYGSWVLARCRMIWSDHPNVHPELQTRLELWKPFQTMSMRELMACQVWDAALPKTMASILDQIVNKVPGSSLDMLIQRELAVLADAEASARPAAVPEVVPEVPTTPVEIAATCPFVAEETHIVRVKTRVDPAACSVDVRFEPGATIAQLVQAECALHRVSGNSISLQGAALMAASPLTHGMELDLDFDARMQVDESSDSSASPDWHMSAAHHVSSEFRIMATPSPLVTLDVDALLGLTCPTPTHLNHVDSLRRQAMRVGDRVAILGTQQHVMADDEILWHLRQAVLEHTYRLANRDSGRPCCFEHVVVVDPLLMYGWMQSSTLDIRCWVAEHCRAMTCIITIALVDGHWVPVVMWKNGEQLQVYTWDEQTANHDRLQPIFEAFAQNWGLQGPVVQRNHRLFVSNDCCGALALSFIQNMLFMTRLPANNDEAQEFHSSARTRFQDTVITFQTTIRPWQWGKGTQEQTQKELAALLVEQGVPNAASEDRAAQAIRSIGLKHVANALTLKHPWKQLKQLGNSVKFQFILQSELEAKIQNAAGKSRPKGSKRPKHGFADSSFQMDPRKLQISPGCFEAGGQTLEQLNVEQMGPLAEGVGSGDVSKVVDKTLVKVDALAVCTVKVLIYQDETDDWPTIQQQPLKYVVSKVPCFSICDTLGCKCACWHPPSGSDTKTVLTDVWRRQHLKHGFKPVAQKDATIFSACLRFPEELLTAVLAASGGGGIYFEPRSADARDVDQRFSVVWLPKMSKADVLRLKHSSSAALGIVRIGDRLGLRAESGRAQELHNAVRPDTIFLASGTRMQFQVGPMPFGTDRQALTKALKELQWDVKPLQPITSVAGRGNLWLVVSVSEPPQPWFQMDHGEVVVTKHKPNDKPDRPEVARPVASSATMQLLGQATSTKNSARDPWQFEGGGQFGDPWQKPGAPAKEPSAALKAFESAVETSVLAKIPAADAQNARLTNLEQQVQHLIQGQTTLATQVQESEARSAEAITVVQTQLNQQHQQYQQLHGALQSQEQNIQAMFQSQMTQIRSILTKRDGKALGDFAFRTALPHLKCSDRDGFAWWADAVGYGGVVAYAVLIPLFIAP